MFTCEFCGKELSTKVILKTHQEKAKYCLDKQHKASRNTITCEFCDKEFSTKYRKTTHIEKCMTRIENERQELVTLREENKSIKPLIEQNKSLISKIEQLSLEKQKAEIYIDLYNKDQQFILEQSKRLVEKSGNTTTTIKAKTVTMNALNLSQERLESLKDTYTMKYYNQGGIGQADWVVDNILTDSNGNLIYRCTDKNRKNFVFNDDKGNVVNDMEAKKLKEAIRPVVNTKLREYKTTKYLELANEDDDDNSKLEKVNDLYVENRELGMRFEKRLIEKTYRS